MITHDPRPRALLRRVLAWTVIATLLVAAWPRAASGQEQPRLEFQSDAATIAFRPDGTLERLTLTGREGNLAHPEGGPVLEVDLPSGTHAVTSLTWGDDLLVATFGASGAHVGIAVTGHGGWLRFEVVDVQPEFALALRLTLPVTVLPKTDVALGGTYSDDALLALRPLTENTHAALTARRGTILLRVEAVRQHGIKGAAGALIACPPADLFETVADIESEAGLTTIRFGDVHVRESAAARESYLFLTSWNPGRLQDVIASAKLAGLRRVLILRDIWRTSEGQFTINTANFPGGLADLAKTCKTIRDAGLGVGLHLYGPSASHDDPWVAPVPRDGLLAVSTAVLAEDVGASATTLELVGSIAVPQSRGGGFPGRVVRIGDELIRYREQASEAPYQLIGCERGALGTTSASHVAGASLRHLVELYGQLLLDPDGPLREEFAANLAEIVNETGADFVYLDGPPAIPAQRPEPGQPNVRRWYYLNRHLPALARAVGRPFLLQTGVGPGRDLEWHLVPRSASADGHGDIKHYLEKRQATINSFLRGFTVPDVGWYGFGSGRSPDYLEYICGRVLGWDASMSLQTYPAQLDADPRAREVMEMIGRYERCRAAGALSVTQREAFLEPGAEFRLLESGDDWSVFRAAYDVPRDVRKLRAGVYEWHVFNTTEEPQRLGLELVRGAAIHVPATLSGSDATTLETFRDVSVWGASDANAAARDRRRVEAAPGPWGSARTGIDLQLASVEDPSIGGGVIELVAKSERRTIGWCAASRRYDPPLDLGQAEALGLWVRGDASGVTVSVRLLDDDGRVAVYPVPVFHDGWRLFVFPRGASSIAWERVSSLMLDVSDIAPGTTPTLRFALLRAGGGVRKHVPLEGLTLEVGERAIRLPLEIAASGSARIDGLGRLSVYPGGMQPSRTSALRGGALVVPPGKTRLRLIVKKPDRFQGDLTLRVSRLTPIPE